MIKYIYTFINEIYYKIANNIKYTEMILVNDHKINNNCIELKYIHINED